MKSKKNVCTLMKILMHNILFWQKKRCFLRLQALDLYCKPSSQKEIKNEKWFSLTFVNLSSMFFIYFTINRNPFCKKQIS